MIKRTIDILLSLTAIIVLSPLFAGIALYILFTSKGGAIYAQPRIGKGGKEFRLLKFRTMFTGSDIEKRITIGTDDKRITPAGRYLRKYKLDELPQLFNVLTGSMSLVGPRPEVQEYVALYNTEQKQVLNVKPGITDYASLEYYNENELLASTPNPDEYYINVIMPAKLTLNLKYIKERRFMTDMKIIWKTVRRIISNT